MSEIKALYKLWHYQTLSRAQRKALRRCLIDKVVLERRVPDTITTRMVWRGGAVSALEVPCSVGRLADVSDFAPVEAQIVRLDAQGKSDEDIAQSLTRKGFRSSHHAELLPSTVRLIRLQHGRLHRYWGHGLSHLMSRGRIGVQRDEATGLYLFPDRPETLEGFRQLRDGDVSELRY